MSYITAIKFGEMNDIVVIIKCEFQNEVRVLERKSEYGIN